MNEMTSGKTVGVVGLGAMGKGLSANLAKHFKTFGFDTVEAACAQAEQAGVVRASSVEELFGHCAVVVLSLPNEDVVKAVVDGVIAGRVGEGRVIFDTSTTTPQLARELSERCARARITFLDAPVTGGAWGAERGELSIMVGGESGPFEEHRDVLEALGTTITRIGPSGHGQVAKMVNQMLMAAIYTSVNESFAFAVRQGADIEKIFRAVEGGGGRSMLLNKMKGPMLEGTLHDDFGLRQHGKDVRYAMQAAEASGIDLPVTKAVHEFFQRSCDVGLAAIWAGEMWAVWEKLYAMSFRETIGWEERSKG